MLVEVAMSLFVASGIIGEVAVIEPLECGQVAASFSWHRAIAEHEMLHSSTLTLYFSRVCVEFRAPERMSLTVSVRVWKDAKNLSK